MPRISKAKVPVEEYNSPVPDPVTPPTKAVKPRAKKTAEPVAEPVVPEKPKRVRKKPAPIPIMAPESEEKKYLGHISETGDAFFNDSASDTLSSLMSDSETLPYKSPVEDVVHVTFSRGGRIIHEMILKV